MGKSQHSTVTEQRTSVLILSTADFDAPVWTNKQHLAAGLAESMPVVYIESIGLRQPSFTKTDITRIAKKLMRLVIRRSDRNRDLKHEQALARDLQIITPNVIPFHKYSSIRRVNKFLLQRTVKSRVDLNNRITLWTFSPLTYGLETLADTTVYHSVDLLHDLPGVPASTLIDEEKNTISKSTHVIASSVGVREHLEAQGASDVTLWENVASVELFTRKNQVRQNRAIFAGNLTPTKLNTQLLQQLLDSGVPIAFAGPISIDGVEPGSDITRILDHPNAEYLGNLSLVDLADAVCKSMVGLIPYRTDGYTRGVFPMKIYEYLAAGLAVASTNLLSLSQTSIFGLHLHQGNQDFVDTVHTQLREFTEEAAIARSASAKPFSWTSRIEQANELLRVDNESH